MKGACSPAKGDPVSRRGPRPRENKRCGDPGSPVLVEMEGFLLNEKGCGFVLSRGVGRRGRGAGEAGDRGAAGCPLGGRAGVRAGASRNESPCRARETGEERPSWPRGTGPPGVHLAGVRGPFPGQAVPRPGAELRAASSVGLGTCCRPCRGAGAASERHRVARGERLGPRRG